MSDFYNFAGQPPKSGGGPEEDPNHPVNAARTEGFHVLPFGIALGLMFLLFFGFFNSFLPRPGIDIWSRFVFSFEPMLGMVYFIYGFIFRSPVLHSTANNGFLSFNTTKSISLLSVSRKNLNSILYPSVSSIKWQYLNN